MDTVDLISYAAHQGIVLSHAIAGEALAGIDRTPLESTEKDRYRAVAWDGKTDPPIGESSRWLHGKDGPSRFAQSSIAAGGVVYFIFRDGNLMYWQPYRIDGGASSQAHMVEQPGHVDHWEDAANAHIGQIVSGEVDAAILRKAMDKALALHEDRKVPYHVSVETR